MNQESASVISIGVPVDRLLNQSLDLSVGQALGLSLGETNSTARGLSQALAPLFDPILGTGQLSLLLSSILWALGIAFGAVLLGLAPAWAVRKRPYLATLLLVPMVLPSYLAYAGLNILRAPRTWLGDFGEHLAQSGFKEAPLLIGRIIAYVGITLWIWPIAAVVMLPFMRSLDDECIESFSLESKSRIARLWHITGMLRRALLAAMGCVFLVALGSSVPLHVAQVRTLAMAVWIALVQAPGTLHPYAASWPLLLIGACGAIVISRWLSARPSWHGQDDRRGGGTYSKGRVPALIAAAIWCASVVLPLVLFAGQLRSLESLQTFWLVAQESIIQSAIIAAWVFVSSLAASIVVWYMLTDAAKYVRAAGHLIIAMALFTALAPGILIGHACAVIFALPWLEAYLETPAPVIVAHLLRFGVVGMVCVAMLVRAQPVSLLESRLMDGGNPIRNFIGTQLPRGLAVVPASALAAACMSLHEVESAIVVQAPGSASLAQLTLGYLHFTRTQELSAVAVLLVATSGLLAIFTSLLCAWHLKREISPGEPMK